MRKPFCTIGLFFTIATAGCGSSPNPTPVGGSTAQDGGSGLGGTGGGGASSAAGGTTGAKDGAVIPPDGAVIPTGGAAGSGDVGSSSSGGGSSSTGGSSHSSDGNTGDSSGTEDAAVAPTPDGANLSGPDFPLPESVVKASPPLLNFGEIAPGQVSHALDVTVTNTGPLVLITPTVAGSAFSIASTTCGTAPAASCTVSVKFAPVTQGPANGELTIAQGIAIPLSGTGSGLGLWTIAPATIPTTLLVNQSAPITITVTATATLFGLSCLPSGADLTSDAVHTTCGSTIAAGTPCVYAFTFRSAVAGAKSESIVCSASGDVKSVIVNPTVLLAGPSLTLTPATASFSATVGAISTTIFTVANPGGSIPASVTATLDGANPDQFAITGNKCLVPPASPTTCAITVAFRPTSAGATTAVLTVTDATPGATPASATLSGGALTGPILTITGAADLGTVSIGLVGTSAAYTMTNSGQTATGALSVIAEDHQFTIGSDLCTGTSLAPAKTCTFAIAFRPTLTGIVTSLVDALSGGVLLASLQIHGDGLSVPLGTISMTPAALDFGTISLGTVNATKTFTVTNIGANATRPLSVVKNDGMSSFGGAAQFSYTTTCSPALAASQSCQVVVAFQPTGVGSFSATFMISDGTMSSEARTVTGTAL